MGHDFEQCNLLKIICVKSIGICKNILRHNMFTDSFIFMRFEYFIFQVFGN